MKNNKEKTLILTQTNPDIDVMYQGWQAADLNAGIIFKNVVKPLRAVRRVIANCFPAYFLSVWLNNWKKELLSYDTVIIHASELTNHLPEYIHSINSKIRIIYWYWNPVNKHTNPKRVTDKNVEFWTFDRADVKRYKMHYNIQYYGFHPGKISNQAKYDVYFIGHDKGRKKQLDDLVKIMSNSNISYKIDLINDKSNQFISYDTVRKNIANSKAILEINQKGQLGYTLRALESLFFMKKLITNNKVIKEADFYCNDNIFILGEDNIKDLKRFITSPYNEKVDSFQYEYNVDSWFNNFFMELGK